jgi:signal transduction histidine kinase/ActR/RegA family two-component response regulator
MTQSPTLDIPETATDADLEKVRLIFRNAGIAQAIATINAAVLVFVLGGTRPPLWAVCWCLVAVALAAGRYALARRFFAAEADVSAAPAWRRRAIASALAAAILWGGGGAAMMVADPNATRLFVALVMAGMVAGAVPLLSSVPLAFRAYAIPVMSALILTAVIDSHGARDWMLALVGSLYLVALLQSSRYFHESLDSSLRMTARTQRMATQLEEALHSAQAASEAKSRFLATMSHEIRTPLNGVLGMAQLLLMPNLDEGDRYEHARTILNSGQTLLTLLNDILDLSKIEAGRIELESLVFDPEQTLREVAALFAERAEAKGLKLEVAWTGAPMRRYRADPIRLRQMLSNLVNNAIKFTARGAIRIEGHEAEREAGEAFLEFAVTDTGIGIPADKQAILFMPFSQVDASTTREYGGTGLGLSIVRNLATLMGGDVGLESEPGKGTRVGFRIRASLVKDTDESRQPGRDAATAAPEATALPGDPYVLVVEDNATNRRVIEVLLKRQGVRFESVENGEEAVARITAGAVPDLVLMDVQMPVMDGLEAARRIRRWEQQAGRPRLPIVALTAGAFEEDRKHCQAAGMDDFLTKPLDLEKLKAALERWLLG